MPDTDQDSDIHADQDTHGHTDAYGNPYGLSNAHWYRHADAHGFTYTFTYRDRDAISDADAKRITDSIWDSLRMLLDAGRGSTADPDEDADAEPYTEAAAVAFRARPANLGDPIGDSNAEDPGNELAERRGIRGWWARLTHVHCWHHEDANGETIRYQYQIHHVDGSFRWTSADGTQCCRCGRIDRWNHGF